MLDTVFEYPKNFQATGLVPEELAKNDQEFFIYNPFVKRFWRVSTDSPLLGEEKDNFFMITDEDYQCGPQRFKLKDLGNGEYHIVTMDRDAEKETGFVYLSEITKGVKTKSRRVMSSATVDDKSAYKFNFKKHPQQYGNFRIHCDGQTLYASIGGHNVKADDRYKRYDEIWFQLNLLPDAEIETEIMSTYENITKESLYRDMRHSNEEDKEQTIGDDEQPELDQQPELYQLPELDEQPELDEPAAAAITPRVIEVEPGETVTVVLFSAKQEPIKILTYDQNENRVKYKGKTYTSYSLQSVMRDSGEHFKSLFHD